MVPAAPGNPRVQELLDQVRQEFEAEMGRTGDMERQSKFALTLRTCRANIPTHEMILEHWEVCRIHSSRPFYIWKRTSCRARLFKLDGIIHTGGEEHIILMSSTHVTIRCRLSLNYQEISLTCVRNRSVASQIQEMDLVRNKVYQLEQAQMQIKQKYAYLSSLWQTACLSSQI